MSLVNKRLKRQSLHGWVKWAPLLGIVFSVLFVDCWLSTQRRMHDFDLAALVEEITKTRAALERLEGLVTEREKLDVLDELAVEMGMVKPEVGQIEHIYYDPVRDLVLEEKKPFAIALGEVRLDDLDAKPGRRLAAPAAVIGEGLPDPAVWE
mgnify:CR=1 FL=1